MATRPAISLDEIELFSACTVNTGILSPGCSAKAAVCDKKETGPRHTQCPALHVDAVMPAVHDNGFLDVSVVAE